MPTRWAALRAASHRTAPGHPARTRTLQAHRSRGRQSHAYASQSSLRFSRSRTTEATAPRRRHRARPLGPTRRVEAVPARVRSPATRGVPSRVTLRRRRVSSSGVWWPTTGPYAHRQTEHLVGPNGCAQVPVAHPIRLRLPQPPRWRTRRRHPAPRAPPQGRRRDTARVCRAPKSPVAHTPRRA